MEGRFIFNVMLLLEQKVKRIRYSFNITKVILEIAVTGKRILAVWTVNRPAARNRRLHLPFLSHLSFSAPFRSTNLQIKPVP
ncbi:hypothetical protein L1887_03211 [Cichorium endivia]|nr:hypothetical protein L1887_03211 [Cichorium endivia]